MHLVLSQANKVSRPCKVIEELVVPQDVAGVDAQEAFNALTEVLHAVGLHLIEFPIHALRAVDGGNPLSNVVIPAHVGDEVLHVREGLHGADFDGLAGWRFCDDVTHSCHAHQAWPSVDFSRARAALAGFAVPADGHVGLLVVLDAVQAVEHDHAFVKFQFIGLKFGIIPFAA